MVKQIGQKLAAAKREGSLFFFRFIGAWFVLGFCKLAIRLTPFNKLATLLGTHDGLAPRVPLCDEEQESKARQISMAVRTAAKYHIGETNCFPQALAARLLLGLGNIPFALFFGVRRCTQSDELQAHAWVVSGRIRVTGGGGFKNYTSVGCFVSDKSH